VSVKKSTIFLIALIFLSGTFFALPRFMENQEESLPKKKHPIAIAVHGGASDIKKMNLTPEQEKKYLETLDLSVQTGYMILLAGGKSEDAVVASIKVLEDSPLFNAGKGSVFTNDSTVEMDAAIMVGNEEKAGAVAGVMRLKNPIEGAKLVKDSSKYVFLYGSGADDYGFKHGLPAESQEYFKTEFRRNQWLKIQHSDTTHLDNEGPIDERKVDKFGTVGCVAIDASGVLCAGTSTGGIVNKRYHRIGDSPIIGAGTYANRYCAVSCTGKGEEFIRLVVAKDIASLMEYKKYSLDKACKTVIQNKLTSIGGRGGCIAIDCEGHIVMEFTTSGMFRGSINAQGKKELSIYAAQPAAK
jgi:L-asparaginase / beta-aspartyl-peptidase